MHRIYSRLILYISIVIIVIVGIVTTIFTLIRTDQSIRGHLADRAETIAQLLPTEDILGLRGNINDENSPQYEHLKEMLMNIRAVNPDVRFVYLLAEAKTLTVFPDEQPASYIVFLADSEPEFSPDLSPPGQIYDEASPEIKQMFVDNRPFIQGPTSDRWGTWVSALAPIFVVEQNPETGAIEQTMIASVGLDVAAADYYRNMVVYGMIPGLITSLFVIIMLSAFAYIRRERRLVETKAKFLAIASHEIRTPLTGLRWTTESLLKKNAMSKDDTTLVALIHKSTLRVIERLNMLLTADALEHSRYITLRTHDINMRTIINSCIDDLKLFSEHRGVQFVLDKDFPEYVILPADEEKMRHVFSNLFSNAAKFTALGSSVEVGYKKNVRSHTFMISDRGPGVNKAEKHLIFSGYFSAGVRHGDMQQEGSGIGLYLVQQYIKLHGGTIDVYNREGGGAVFVFTLPSA